MGEHITLTNPMMELTWFPVTDEIKQLLKQAADAWGDSAEADRLMEAAIAQSNHDLTVLTAAYRFFFYKNNNRAALRVAEAVISQVRASGNLPEDWETLKGILRDRKEEPEIRFRGMRMMIRPSAIKSRDWLVTDEGQCQPRPSLRDWDLIRDKYYLHRFLTEIEDLLNKAHSETEEWDFLPQIRMRVRQLVTNSYFVQTQFLEPDPQTGVAIFTLYDEIGYPLTVETVNTAPGILSPIHNHGTWGVVALLKGQDRHTFWRRVPDAEFPGKIEQVGEKILNPGEIISFTPEAIHQVQAVGDEPSLTFNLYGDTQPRSRFIFDTDRYTAKSF